MGVPFVIGNNRQNMPVWAKTIPFWVLKVLSTARAHLSLDTLWGAAVSEALKVGI